MKRNSKELFKEVFAEIPNDVNLCDTSNGYENLLTEFVPNREFENEIEEGEFLDNLVNLPSLCNALKESGVHDRQTVAVLESSLHISNIFHYFEYIEDNSSILKKYIKWMYKDEENPREVPRLTRHYTNAITSEYAHISLKYCRLLVKFSEDYRPFYENTKFRFENNIFEMNSDLILECIKKASKRNSNNAIPYEDLSNFYVELFTLLYEVCMYIDLEYLINEDIENGFDREDIKETIKNFVNGNYKNDMGKVVAKQMIEQINEKLDPTMWTVPEYRENLTDIFTDFLIEARYHACKFFLKNLPQLDSEGYTEPTE